jgi:hypothetical protein
MFCQLEATVMAPRCRLAAIVSGLVLSASIAVAIAAAASSPPVVFQVEGEAGLAAARLCERIWSQHGTALAADILPVGVVADTVLCLVLTSERFDRYFADRLPDWGVGVALPPGRVIALDYERLPVRGPGAEVVFMHEMAHALLFQAAGEVPLPTWLHEGVAMRAAGEWRFVDTLSVVLSGSLPTLASLAGPFPRGEAAAQRAYRTSLLAVNWLEREHGPGAVSRVVAAARRHGEFAGGFASATGRTPEQFASAFDGAMRLRFGWILLVFRWPTLFVLMALLFSIGAVRKIVINRRNLAAAAAEAEEADDADDADGPPLGGGL